MTGPLEGIKVVEISMFQQGPVAGMRLGDLGAGVIKIEAPSGDPARGFMDPQAMSNNYFIEVDHPEWGKTKVAGFPWDFSETPASWRRRAPRLGEPTNEILSELGYLADDLKALKKEGIIS